MHLCLSLSATSWFLYVKIQPKDMEMSPEKEELGLIHLYLPQLIHFLGIWAGQWVGLKSAGREVLQFAHN